MITLQAEKPARKPDFACITWFKKAALRRSFSNMVYCLIILCLVGLHRSMGYPSSERTSAGIPRQDERGWNLKLEAWAEQNLTTGCVSAV